MKSRPSHSPSAETELTSVWPSRALEVGPKFRIGGGIGGGKGKIFQINYTIIALPQEAKSTFITKPFHEVVPETPFPAPGRISSPWERGFGFVTLEPQNNPNIRPFNHECPPILTKGPFKPIPKKNARLENEFVPNARKGSKFMIYPPPEQDPKITRKYAGFTTSFHEFGRKFDERCALFFRSERFLENTRTTFLAPYGRKERYLNPDIAPITQPKLNATPQIAPIKLRRP